MASSQIPSQEVLEEWRELESDPGVFSLLVEDYGVRDIIVQEIYDASKKIETKVYGFVFLFRFELGDRRSRKAARSMIPEDTFVLEAEVVNTMFFAHQIINNSCATHALLSVLLNVKDLDLGPTLTKLKEFSEGLNPESKGLAITNMVELAHIHNKYAKPTHIVAPPPGGKRACVLSSAHALLPETYHFVSFVPINDRLFELDGLKEFPIDHGPWGEHEKWTDLFQRVISFRLAQSPNLLFNLLAIVPDPIPDISEHLKSLHEEQNSLLEEAGRIADEVAEKETQSESNTETFKDVGEESSKQEPLKEPKGPPVKESSKQEKELGKPSEEVRAEDQEMAKEVSEPDKEMAAKEPSKEIVEPGKEQAKETHDLDKEELPQVKPEQTTKEAPIDVKVESKDNGDSEMEVDQKESDKMEEDKMEVDKMEADEKQVKKEKRDILVILEEAARDLPTDDEELQQVVLTEPDNNSLDSKLRIAIAKVVINNKKLEEWTHKLKEELEVKQRYRVEHFRRTHDYDPFITEFIKMLSQNGQLPARVMKRPSMSGGVANHRRKNKENGRSKKQKTTLLVNGAKVN